MVGAGLPEQLAAITVAVISDDPLDHGADSEGSRPRIRDDVAQHSDLISLGVPR
jgi:hypothetical protein